MSNSTFITSEHTGLTCQKDWSHVPVALPTIISLIKPAVVQEDAKIKRGIDATFGLGGHAIEILENFPQVNLLGIDRDPEAIKLAKNRYGGYSDRLRLINSTYDQIDEFAGGNSLNFILFDLGVSSPQLDNPYRGFSYSKSAPLDMRMNQQVGIKASDILANCSEKELENIFRKYGQEKFAKRIAKNIVLFRTQEHYLETTDELVAIIYESIPAPARRSGGHPAKRVFQALRIAVNNELELLQIAINKSLKLLAPGGRLIVMSYHSGEDMPIKKIFDDVTKVDLPPNIPISTAKFQPSFTLVRPKLIKASAAEISKNSRAKSVRIRAIEKIRKI